MAYKQIYMPNIDIGAVRGWCLGYVDDALNAPDRSYSAQIAYNRAVARGWVKNDYNFPVGYWIVLFLSIDNGSQAGLGHVALAFIGENGAMQIHDSEVHAGARGAYGSIQELLTWFASGGVQLTYLGWSIGCDGRAILETPEEVAQKQAEQEAVKKAEAEAQRKAEEAEAQRQAEEIERKRVTNMAECIVRVKYDADEIFIKDSVWYWSTATGWINLDSDGHYNILDNINKQKTGKILPRVYSEKTAPYHILLEQINSTKKYNKPIRAVK